MSILMKRHFLMEKNEVETVSISSTCPIYLWHRSFGERGAGWRTLQPSFHDLHFVTGDSPVDHILFFSSSMLRIIKI